MPALLPGRRAEVLQEHLENVFGASTVRDQKPIDVESLAGVLDGMTVAQLLHELNSRVCLFVQAQRMLGLLTARSYRARPHTVITIDTEKFMAQYEPQIELCSIISGFVRRDGLARQPAPSGGDRPP